jgi:hypothetical protein
MGVKNNPSGKLMVPLPVNRRASRGKKPRFLGRPARYLLARSAAHSWPLTGALPTYPGRRPRQQDTKNRFVCRWLSFCEIRKPKVACVAFPCGFNTRTAEAARRHRMKRCLYIDGAMRFLSAATRGKLHVASSTDFSGNHGFPLRRR